MEGDVQAAGDRNLLAGQPFRARRVELQHVADVAGLPLAPLPIGCPELATSSAASSSTCASTTAANERSAAARSAGASRGPTPLGRLRARDRVVDAGRRRACSTVRNTSSVAGLISFRRAHHALTFPSHVRVRPRPRPANSRRSSRRLLRMPLHRQTQNASPASSTASMTPSPRRVALTIRPSPSSVDRLVVVALRVGRLADQRRQPGAGHRAHRRRGEHRVARAGGRSWPSTSGRCWCRVPPSATLSTCAPRQMPSTGSRRASAPRSSANSQASRSRARARRCAGACACA